MAQETGAKESDSKYRWAPYCGTFVKLTRCFLNEQLYSSKDVTARIMGARVAQSANRRNREHLSCRRRRGYSRSCLHHAGVERLPLYSSQQRARGPGSG